MKNAIVYYYNLTPSDIHQRGKEFTFHINEVNYMLFPVERSEQDVKMLYELLFLLYQYGIYYHQIISNKDNQLVTFINGSAYVLLRIYINDRRKVMLKDLDLLNNVILSDDLQSKKMNWYDLWTKKIDYFEYQINQLGRKFPLIRESFSYFIGLGENAISLIRNVVQVQNYVSHFRVSVNNSLIQFYNPLNLVIDNRVRDACEYFKSCFFELKISLEQLFLHITNYIESNYLTIDECLLFLGRMIYPTYYFDMYEQVVENKISEKNLLNIISRVDEYEDLLRKLYQYLKSIMTLPEIEWLAL